MSDAWRACVGTGRFGLALRRDHQDSHITGFNSSYRPDNPVHDTAYHAVRDETPPWWDEIRISGYE